MNQAVREGIYTLAATATGLSSSNLYYAKAPEGKTGIYCVFYGIDDTLEFDSTTQDNISNIQFSFFGTNLTSLETVVESFKGIFDFGEASLAVTGWGTLRLRGMLSIPAQRIDDVYRVILEYEVRVDKAR